MSQFGVMNSLRTGNVVWDMAICMCIPMVFKFMENLMGKADPMLTRFISLFQQDDKMYTKTLEYEFRTNKWGYTLKSGKEERNNILQKAILLYIADMKGVKMKTSKMSFIAMQEKGYRDDNYDMVYGGTSEQLEQYQVNTVPPYATWIDLDAKTGLRFQQTIAEPDEGGEGKESNRPMKTNIVYTFQAPNPKGEEVIDAWVNMAFQTYKDKMKSLADHSRYLYMLLKDSGISSSKDDDDDGDKGSTRVYKRYKLSEEKTFECLFFKEKKMLLKLMSHFSNKTGKYMVKGFPHKLGLLLHGPPGTGKTSLIKAMAQHTGRSVVSIPLARIETNQELMDIIFDQSFAVKGEDMPIKLAFKDVIFVMEDVDAASPIVLSRKTDEAEKGGDKVEEVSTTVDASDAPTVGIATGDDGVPDDTMAAVITSMLTAGTGSDSKGAGFGSKYSSKFDKLDLAGLLNVLDGVVDCPNRILIMTTNHPEKLDAALIRPGRIDKIIYLGYIQAEEAKEMLELYFVEALTDAQSLRLECAMDNPPGICDFTPAELEQLCAEYDEIDHFLTALEDKVQELTVAHHLKNGVEHPKMVRVTPSRKCSGPSTVEERQPKLMRMRSDGSTVAAKPILSRGLSSVENSESTKSNTIIAEESLSSQFDHPPLLGSDRHEKHL